MSGILILYYGKTDATEKMARAVARGCADAEVAAKMLRVDDVSQASAEDLLEYDGIIIGSPAYYGGMAWPLKRLLDNSARYHQQLQGKVGAAFSSSANVGGGNETTVLAILQAMLVHGMIVQGSPTGDHFGPVSVGLPDEKVEEQCEDLGRKVARLVRKLTA